MGLKEKILVVDDEEIVRVQIGRVLSKEGYDVFAAPSGEEALGLMENTPIDVVLSDMVMENMDGLSFLKEVNRRFPGTLFIIITGHGSLATAIDSMRLGAFDYLLKPCENEELKLRVKRALKERRLQKKVESQTRKLEQMAITDGLTGLYSRSYFMEALEREFKLHLRYRSSLSFMMIDIDFFKKINDKFGHPVGDTVLRNISGKFREIIRETDVIGRYGGEEFGVIQPRTGPDGALVSAARILSSVSADASLCNPRDGKSQRITVSIGIASCPNEDIKSASQLIKAADKALYEAKRSGRNRFVVYGAAASGDQLAGLE